MGKGIDLARIDAPEHAALIDDLKDQLLIVFMRRLGGKTIIPIKEVDETGQYVLAFSIKDGSFHFILKEKQ